MGLQLLALAKLKFLATSRGPSPVISALVWPFLVKLSLSSKLVRSAYADAIDSSRLFFFQLGQIAFHAEPADLGSASRWERALRLVSRRMRIPATRSLDPISDEHSLHTLSMLAL